MTNLFNTDLSPHPQITDGRVPYQAHSDTSKAAAKSNTSIAGWQEEIVMISMEQYPKGLTDEQIYNYLINTKFITADTKDSSIRRARVGLVDKGLIIDTGERRELKSGRMGTVWGRKGDK